jgi:hypothetical protein
MVYLLVVCNFIFKESDDFDHQGFNFE